MTEPNIGADPGAAAPAAEPAPAPAPAPAPTPEPPARPPGGPSAEPAIGPDPAAIGGPGAPAGQPGATPPGTGDGLPAEIELPEGFDPYTFLKSRTGAEPTLANAGRQLYEQRRAFGQQGSEISTLRQQLANQNATIQRLEREGGGGRASEGDIYDTAVSQMESQHGARPDPEENPDGVRRWDANFNSAVTSLTMDRHSQFQAADNDGARIGDEFLADLPTEHQVEFSYAVNSLLGDDFQRSNLSRDLLSVIYQGLMYEQSVSSAYRAGASARAAQLVDAQAGGPPIHTGPGGGPAPAGTEGWTHESLLQAANDGAIEPAEFDRVMKELVQTGNAPPRHPAEVR